MLSTHSMPAVPPDSLYVSTVAKTTRWVLVLAPALAMRALLLPGTLGTGRKIAIVRDVAGVQVPSSPFATSPAELVKLAGYWRDIRKSRGEARRLLRLCACASSCLRAW